MYITPTDGNYDDPVEPFTFTTPTLSLGVHTIEAYVSNSIGNNDPTPASDTITIKKKAINTPFQWLYNFLVNHQNLFPVLQILLKWLRYL
jgi:hypothetical protein